MNIEQAKAKARAAIESTYTGTCEVSEYTNSTGSGSNFTRKTEVVVLSDVPCRLSYNRFNNMHAATQTDTISNVSQEIKLLLAPETVIKSGSKIVVTQCGVTTAYKSSGAPSYYPSHQEITLELFKGWT